MDDYTDHDFDRTDDGGFVPPDGRVEFQPASPGDLARHAPRDATCARVRGMLRDYTDGDLPVRHSREVDEHAHRCRDCSLALARAELEVLRLRQAFAQDRAAAQDLPAGLGGRVRERIDLDVSAGEPFDSRRQFAAEPGARSDAGIGDSDASEPSPDFTRIVMERISKEWRRPSLVERVRSRRRYVVGGVVLAAAAAVFVLSLLLSREESAPAARVVAASANGVWRDAADLVHGAIGGGVSERSAVRTGDALAVGDRLELESGANLIGEIAALGGDVVDSRGGSSIAARIEFEDSAAMRIGAGTLALERGSARVTTSGAFVLSGLADGVAELRPGGRYDVRVAPRRSFDGALAAAPTMGVRFEVLDGTAEIVRGGRRHSVRAGQVAHFGHTRPFTVEGSASPALLAEVVARDLRKQRASGAGVASSPLPPRAIWRGRVVDDATGLGVAGATVKFDLGTDVVSAQTEVDGGYEIPAGQVSLCVVEVLPPDDAGLHRITPRPLALPSFAGEAQVDAGASSIETLRMVATRPVWGTVRDHQQQPLAAARIVPCVVDEVFGLCEVREELAVLTDDNGRFELPFVPVDVGSHESVVLLVEHTAPSELAHPTTAFRDLRDAGVVALEFVLDAPRDVRLAGLPASRRVQVYQDVPGIARQSFSIKHEVATDASGQAKLARIGAGRLWFYDRELGVGVPLVRDVDEHGLTVWRADGPDAGGALPLASLGAQPGWVHRAGSRFASYRAQPSQPTNYLTVFGRDGIVQPGTRLFVLERGQARPEFLGEYTGLATFPFVAPDGGFTIIAIAADGSVGYYDGGELRGPHCSIQMHEPGAVEFELPEGGPSSPIAAGSAAMLLFRMVDGPLAGQEFWRVVTVAERPRVEGLLPGNYVVEFGGATAGSVEVSVQPDGVVRVGLPLDHGIRPR